MLPAAARLRRRAEFTTVVRSGVRAGSPTVAVHLVLPDPAGPDDRPARAGFVVSRMVGPATVRNRVRRRLRHLVRPVLTRLPPGSLLVVRAQPDAADASFGQLDADLAAAVERARRRAAR